MNIDINTFNGLLGTTKIGIMLVCAACFMALCIVLAAVFAAGKRMGGLEAERNMRGALDDAREDAVKRSRAVLTGQIGEQFAPLLPNFPCDVADCRFLGKPVDYIAFCGLSNDSVDEVLFIEIKSGGSSLSRREKSLKEAIARKRVRYVEMHI